MNYLKHYDKLISKAQTYFRHKDMNEYYENHHIVPKCLGGLDDEVNMVLLTAKEHFVAHHLLAKIHGGKMAYAFWAMCNQRSPLQDRQYKVTAIVYESAKKHFSKTHSERMKGFNPWEHGGLGMTGIDHTEETKNKISASNKGKTAGEKHYCFNHTLFKICNINTKELFEGTMEDIREKFDCTRAAASYFVNGKTKRFQREWELTNA